MPVSVQRAITMIQSVHAHAATLNIAVTAAIVDESGRVVALGRMDKARPMTVELAVDKAYTAASFGTPTHELAPQAAQPWFQSLMVSTGGKVMAAGGAFPISEGENILGAIGVAGATEAQEQECCQIAMKA
jgi:uncharacterized protein GlcG (DUF336 family)